MVLALLNTTKAAEPKQSVVVMVNKYEFSVFVFELLSPSLRKVDLFRNPQTITRISILLKGTPQHQLV